jgi:hypothetical protein
MLHRACALLLLSLLGLPSGAQEAPPTLPPPAEAEAAPALPVDIAPAPDAAPPPSQPPGTPPPASLFALNPKMGLVPGVPGAVPFPTLGYRATWFPDVNVSGQNTSLGYVEQNLHGSVPLWSDGPNRWSIMASLRSEIFHTGGTILPDSHMPFPSTLDSVQVGTSLIHQFANGWTAGGSVSVGSASDKPFHSINEMTAGVNAFWRVPQNEQGAWLFSLAYSPTSQLPFPIPGVAYQWYPTDTFRMNIGVPFQLMWRPTDDTMLELSYMLITNVHARATYKITPKLLFYGGYDWQNEGYFLADREDLQQRFYYYDMRVSSGLRYVLGPRSWLEVASGYIFDRFYFQGNGLSERNHDRIELGNGTFLSLQLQHRW